MNTQNEQHDNMFAKGLARSQQNYLDALKAYMDSLLQRANAGLKCYAGGVSGDHATEQAKHLADLVREIGEVSYEIAAVGSDLRQATTSLYEMSQALARRANAYADIFGTPTMTINYTADGEPLGADALLEDYDGPVIPPRGSERELELRGYAEWLQRQANGAKKWQPPPYPETNGGDLVVHTQSGTSIEAGWNVRVDRGGSTVVMVDQENTNQDYSILFVCGNGIARIDVDSKGGYHLEDLEPGTEEHKEAQFDLWGEPVNYDNPDLDGNGNVIPF